MIEILLVICSLALGFTVAWWLGRVSLHRTRVSDHRHALVREKHQIKREYDRLEGLVVARTVALDRRNAEMRLIFDHVEQAFLTVDLEGTIVGEHSAAVEDFLGPLPESGRFVDYVRTFAPLAADWVEMSWTSLVEGGLPVELALVQMPSRFAVGARHLIATYKPIVAQGGRMRVLVVFSDETPVVERERIERDERETTTLVTRMLHDRRGFTTFCSEADRYVAAIGLESEPTEFLRLVHTLKGITAIEGLTSIAELCHDTERAHAEDNLEGARMLSRGLAERWQLLRAKVAPLLDLTEERLDLSFADLDRLEHAIARRVSYDELERQVATWHHDRVPPRLQRYADQVRVLASQLCKDPIEVRVEADPDLRLPTGRFRGFWSTFVHAIRNAVDHGLETSSERALAGKSELGLIVLRAHRTPGQTVIELEDRGRGIDWERVAERARACGLPAETHADLEAALCHDGLSTRDQVSELSGRGVGFGAFRQACVLSGARLTIASTRGVGTKLTVTWSDKVIASAAARPMPLLVSAR